MPLKQQSQRNRSFQRRAAMMGAYVDVGAPAPLDVIEYGVASYDQVGSTEPQGVSLSVPIATAQTAGGSPLSGDVSVSVVGKNSGKALRSFAQFGGNQYVRILNSTDISGDDWTFSGVVRFASIGITQTILSHDGGVRFLRVNAAGDWSTGADGAIDAFPSVAAAVAGVDYEFSLSKVGSTFTLTVNGQSDSKTITMATSSGDYIIGQSHVFNRPLDGSLRDLSFVHSTGWGLAFDDGSGATINDSSGNGNDGTAVNTDATFWGSETYDAPPSTTLFNQVLQWGDDLSAVTTGFTGTLEGGGSIDFAGDPGFESYVITLDGKSVEVSNSRQMILRESWDANGDTYIHYGIAKINLNLANGDYTQQQINAHGLFRHQDLGYGWTSDSNALFIDSVKEHADRTLGEVFLHFRYDLAFLFPESGGAVGMPLRPFWGNDGFGMPTLAMSSKPRGGQNWEDFVAAHMPGWSQVGANVVPIGSPYHMTLLPNHGGAGVHKWYSTDIKMDVSNPAWLQLAAETAALVRSKANALIASLGSPVAKISGVHIGPEKWQFGKTIATSARVFRDWVLNDANPGWILDSNSGGSIEASWPAHGAIFDEMDETVLDIFESAWAITTLMGVEDPTGIVVFDPVNYHVPFGVTGQNIFKAQCLAKYGMTGEQAREYWRDKQYEIAALDHVRYMVPARIDTGAGNSEAELFHGFMTPTEVEVLRDIATFKPLIYPPENQLVPLSV